MDEADILIDSMKLLVLMGLTNPRGGNGSIRVSDENILITPSGIPKHLLRKEDLVLYNIMKNTYTGKYRPSIEVHAHSMTYKVRKDVNAVLHAHLPLATALTDSGLNNWWLAGTVEAKYSVGEVYIATQAEPGSLELAMNIAEGFSKGARIVIIPQHGVFAAGRNVAEALDALIALESTAKYVLTVTLIESIKSIRRKLT